MPELEVQVPAIPEKAKSDTQRRTARAHAQGGRKNSPLQKLHQLAELARQGKDALLAAEKARADRRRDERHKGPRQVWIQGTDAQGATIEEIQIMRDYSHGGFYFVTSLHCYRVGMQLNVIPSFGSLNLEFVAEVVRVAPRPKMAYGVGVKLLHARHPIAPQNCIKT